MRYHGVTKETLLLSDLPQMFHAHRNVFVMKKEQVAETISLRLCFPDKNKEMT